MTEKLIVGYRCKVRPDLENLLPRVEAPANYKDQDKIEAWVKERKRLLADDANGTPYLSTLDEVMIVDPASERLGHWGSEGRGVGGKKQPLCLAVKNWLLKNYHDAWPWDTHPGPRKPQAVFVGYMPRTFLKILGLECAMPQHGQPLPPSLWYGNTDHRDIQEAVIPHEFQKLVGWDAVFRLMQVTPKDGWKGWCVDPEEDVRLVTELAGRLGFLAEPPRTK